MLGGFLEIIDSDTCIGRGLCIVHTDGYTATGINTARIFIPTTGVN